jgi:hypothetical protein
MSGNDARLETEAQLVERMGVDAAVWAKEFCLRNRVFDEANMIGWFANAIEAGRAKGKIEAFNLANEGDDYRIVKVAAALKAAMPGLINPEAWPWKILARAAIEAMEKEDGDLALAEQDRTA